MRSAVYLLALGLAVRAAAAPPPKPGTGPVWGPVVAGLQAGLKVPNEPKEWRMGQDVPLTLLVRNASKAPIKLDHYTPPLIGWAPRVTGPDGKAAPVETPPLDYPVGIASRTLNPGETWELGEIKLMLRAEKASADYNALSATLRAKPGRYRVTFPYRFQPHEKSDAWAGEVIGGPVVLTVR
jgi:hypothetical protein